MRMKNSVARPLAKMVVGHLETGDERHRYRRREHDDDLLQGVEDQFAYRGPLFRQIAEGGVVLELHQIYAFFLSLRAARAHKGAPGQAGLPTARFIY